MIIGVGEWGFRDLPFEEHCKIARKLGFRYMELGIGGDFAGRLSRTMSQKELDQVLECIREYKLSTPFVCIENDFTKGTDEDMRLMVQTALSDVRLAKKLGAEKVRLFSGMTYAQDITDEIWKRMIQAFLEVEKECTALGMQISIETHGCLEAKGKGVIHHHTTSTDKSYLTKLLKELPPTIGINFDPGNLKAVEKTPVIDYVPLLNDRINYCHLKDWVQNDDGSWSAVAVGGDDLDYKPILEKMSFDGVYLIEYEPVEDVEDGIKRSLDYLSSITDVKFE